MIAPALKKLTVTFGEGDLELAVTYLHDGEMPNPATKSRTTIAARMAAVGLRRALESLERGGLLWGGFATNTRESTDQILVERKEHTS
jgi:hypothetical protein